MYGRIKQDLQTELKALQSKGLYKKERIIISPQGASITVLGGKTVLNFCANNYLGLSNHPEVIKSATETIEKWGYGLSSVRFICGTQHIHKGLEEAVSTFLGTEDAILYAAAFDANGGVFEPLLGADSMIISDELNHASIIDGVRLCKAKRFRYKHSDMEDLEWCLQQSESAKYRLIATDGVFSMDGDIARLDKICVLADKYDALVMVDDSHATGYIGSTGRGTAEHHGVMGRVDIITTTFGKALGGASGACTAGRKEIIEMLRQRSRPYLFSNSLAPVIVGATLHVIKMLGASHELRDTIIRNTKYFREQMTKAGFQIVPGETAIVPVMTFHEPLALKMADMLLDEGVYVIGFAYPVVPIGKARIRVQLSAAHSRADLDHTISAFCKVGKRLNILGKTREEILAVYS
ncbi:MAG: glycine C-acetyltransferase [Candidatus Marinimicrobia bacterium]|nr:glycine C-acetyltransferase [Candidatus Neomarinimicrobiota bacterium]